MEVTAIRKACFTKSVASMTRAQVPPDGCSQDPSILPCEPETARHTSCIGLIPYCTRLSGHVHVELSTSSWLTSRPNFLVTVLRGSPIKQKRVGYGDFDSQEIRDRDILTGIKRVGHIFEQHYKISANPCHGLQFSSQV